MREEEGGLQHFNKLCDGGQKEGVSLDLPKKGTIFEGKTVVMWVGDVATWGI